MYSIKLFSNGTVSIKTLTRYSENSVLIDHSMELRLREKDALWEDFSTPPDVQGSPDAFYEVFVENKKIKKAFDLEKNGEALIVPKITMIVAALQHTESFNNRFILTYGQSSNDIYLDALANKSLSVSLPENKEELAHHMMIHDLFNHATLQILIPQYILDFIAIQFQYYIEFKKNINTKYKDSKLITNILLKIEENMVKLFDEAHGSVNSMILPALKPKSFRLISDNNPVDHYPNYYVYGSYYISNKKTEIFALDAIKNRLKHSLNVVYMSNKNNYKNKMIFSQMLEEIRNFKFKNIKNIKNIRNNDFKVLFDVNIQLERLANELNTIWNPLIMDCKNLKFLEQYNNTVIKDNISKFLRK